MKEAMKDRGLRVKGFTFVELMVSMAIFAVAVAIVYAIFISGRRAQTGQEELAQLAQEARGGLEQMEMELRMAGVVTAGLANKPCKMKPDDPLGKAIFIEAIENAVEFEGDVNVNNELDRIRYEYDPGTKIVYRMHSAISNRVSDGLACNASIKNKAGVLKVPVAFFINSMGFSYYDSDGGLMAGPYTTSNQDDTQDISKIKVFVQAKGVQTTGGQPNYRTASMEINLGNIGTSLGVKKDPPQPPTNFDAWDPGVCGIIQMSWTKATGYDITGYKLYYQYSGAADWTTVDIPASRTTWQLSGLDTSKTWLLKLASFDTYGNLSNTTTQENVGPLADGTAPTQPTGVTAVSNAAGVTVSWTGGYDKEPSGDTTDINGQPYRVSYQITYTNTQTSISNTVQIYNGTSYTHTVADADKCINYNFKVKSIDLCGNVGPDSSTVTGKVSTTQDPPQPYFNPSVGGYTGATRGKAKYYRLNVSGTNANAVAFSDTKFIYSSGAGGCTPLTGRPEDLHNPDTMSTMVWSPSPATAGAGGSFAGHWNDAIDAYYCISAYTEDLCQRKSDLLFRYEVRGACNDAGPPLDGSGGLGDCVGDISVRACDADSTGVEPCKTDPFTYCDGVTLFWPKKYNNTGCTAYPGESDGDFLDMETDFFPDIGVGGYILSRATDTSAYNDLAPDPVTGPDTPYFFADANKYESACSNQGIRDGCIYRYKVRPIDCSFNSGTPLEALKPVGVGTVAYFKPGRFAYDVSSSYPTRVIGRSLNIVQFFVKNTAAANMTLTRAVFTWDDENWGGKTGYLKQVDMNTGGSWATIWSGTPVAKGVELDVTDTLVQASSAFGITPEDIKRAGFRLVFVDSAGKPLRMTSNNLGVNPRITSILYYRNESSSTTFSALQTECKPRGGFNFVVPGGPYIDGVQGPTTAAMLNSPAPPAGQMRSDSYLVESTSGVTVTASIHPFLSGSTYVAVPEYGARVYYAVTDFNTVSPPLPADESGENVTAPTNYTGVNMRNTAQTSCTSATCTYQATIPAQPGERVWYYIIATDVASNFGIAPVQGDTFSSYTYDTKRHYYYLWVSGDYDSNPFLVDGITPNPSYQKIIFYNFWATGLSGCSGTSPVDTTSAGSNSTFRVTEYDASNNIIKTETSGPFVTASGAGCSGCYPCETGLPYNFSTTAGAFGTANKVELTVTETKPDFTTRVCTWTKPPGGTSFTSATPVECKGGAY